ncbi:DUF805 domain-containing protein [Novosphingobium beihaiensis]|uniref:DUF805 domain-containing protein n=1 Tax=Novosphingobium beihaiensis TaxID=2930389 RepID=A0ABT0BMR8_9SPHN|nr:DUF805 domain-containing protein [Novosphingobium beihaiensis]MCJ2186351.1 DUF805 domain-containing protein [Novosphingobium beihaiensis]
MIEAVRHNLSNLTNFSGRDSRSTFWFYILFLVIIQIVLYIGFTVFMGGAMMVDAVQSARDGANEAAVQHQVVLKMAGMMRTTMWMSVTLSAVMTAMTAASFTRRLHDSGKSGWIMGLAVVLQLLTIVLSIGMIGDLVTYMSSLKFDDPAAMQAAARAQQGKTMLPNLAGWASYLIVIVFGVWPSSDGDNRYGPEPEHL